jgi:type IV pilus assembly protein PilC
MKFKYQARTKDGELQTGNVEAADKAAANSILSGHNLFILSLESSEKISLTDKLFSFVGGVKRKDLVIFSRQLATVLQAQLSLADSLKTLKSQTENQALKEIVGEISDDVSSGLSFSQALEKHRDIFSDFFVSMVQSAEVTGSLDTAVSFLADYLEKEDNIVGQVKSAMTYPLIVVGLFIIVAAIMVVNVFPQLAPVFANANVQLPVYTQVLIGSGNFVSHWWPALLIVLVIIILMALEYFRSAEGRAVWDDLKTRLPILKKIYMPLTMSRFTNSVSVLIKGGVPLAQALEITSDSVDNTFYREILHNIADSVRQGSLLSEAFQASPYFPPLVAQMTAVGEATGQLEQIFNRLSNFYSRETDKVVDNLVDLIQPLLMIVIGLMVGLLFAAVLIPLYSLTASF